MAIYNLADPLAKQQCELRFGKLLAAGKVVELTDKSAARTMSQNNYLHLTLQYVAAFIGECDVEYVKRNYFKFLANKDLFVYEKEDEVLGRTVQRVRSTRDISKEDMATAISRWKMFCMEKLQLVIPDAEQHELMAAMQAEVNRHIKYLYG